MELSPAARNRPPRQGGKRAAYPPGVAARAASAALVDAVVGKGRPFDEALAGEARFLGLEPGDRALARAIATMALRRRGQIRDALGRLLSKPLPKKSGPLQAILDTAAAQLLFMGAADHAVVSIAVDLAAADRDARHFRALANAVLRALAARRDEFVADQDPARLNTPDWLWRRWVAAYGEDTARAIAVAHLEEPPLDLTVKSDPAAWAARLGGQALPGNTVRLDSRGRIDALAGFGEGAWWVQDFAATLPARLLGDVADKTVLDLCAAPGGKTAQLAAAGARVTAVDLSESRMGRLRENLARLGLEAETVVSDALAFAPDRRFDAVLLDAPCSSTGTIRRHPDIGWLKSAGDIAALAPIQAKLIDRAARLVKPGGTLVYATCSLEPEEGEAQVAAALARVPGLAVRAIQPQDVPGLDPAWLRDGTLRTLPCFAPGEGIAGGMDGFFAARFTIS